MNRARSDGDQPSPADRRRAAAVAGHTGDIDAARRLLEDLDGSVRAAALGALDRTGGVDASDLRDAANDADAVVRRRAAELGATHPEVDLVALTHDPDPLVIEATCWALGERHAESDAVELLDPVVGALGALGGHDDPRCREAARVAALGAIGHPGGLDHVLARIGDKAAVRRRAIVALAAFEGPAVDDALQQALTDRDWQVRQAAEDVIGRDGGSASTEG